MPGPDPRDPSTTSQPQTAEQPIVQCHELIVNNPEAILVVDHDGCIRFANPSACALLGRRREELEGSPFGFPLATGCDRRIEIPRPDKSTLCADLHVVESRWGGRSVCFVTLRRRDQRSDAPPDDSVTEIDTFLAVLCHDLKHPAAGIEGLLTLMRESADSTLSPEDRESLDVAHSESRRMTHMIDEIVRLVRIDQIPSEFRETSVLALAQAAVARVRELANSKGVCIEICGDDRVVNCAAAQLEQALANLLDNAVRYGCTPDSARVTVEVVSDRDSAEVRVKDDGPGIPPKLQDAIFLPFRRIRDSGAVVAGQNRPDEPETIRMGMGLPIARRLAHRSGGTLEIRPAGKGACFALRFAVR
jgi:signal transduction histidine kinase